MKLGGVRHLLLDRDGVLNVERPEHAVVSRGEWEWIPGSLAALVRLAMRGVRVSVVTNQSLIGRGIASVEAIDALHASVVREVAAAGGAIAAFFMCPHAAGDACACRKPSPALALAAIAASGLTPGETLLVGDMERDLRCASGAGVRAALVRTGKGRETELRRTRSEPGLLVFDDLAALGAAMCDLAEAE